MSLQTGDSHGRYKTPIFPKSIWDWLPSEAIKEVIYLKCARWVSGQCLSEGSISAKRLGAISPFDSRVASCCTFSFQVECEVDHLLPLSPSLRLSGFFGWAFLLSLISVHPALDIVMRFTVLTFLLYLPQQVDWGVISWEKTVSIGLSMHLCIMYGAEVVD